jgi:hypothetical protein
MDRNSTERLGHQLVSLNFRVPMEFRKQLRLMAAERGVTMTCLLLELLQAVIPEAVMPAGKRDLQDSVSLPPERY